MSDPTTLRFAGRPRVAHEDHPRFPRAIRDRDVWEVEGRLTAAPDTPTGVAHPLGNIDNWQVEATLKPGAGLGDRDVWELHGGLVSRERDENGEDLWVFTGKVDDGDGLRDTDVWEVRSRRHRQPTGERRRMGALPDQDVWEFVARPGKDSSRGPLTVELRTRLELDD